MTGVSSCVRWGSRSESVWWKARLECSGGPFALGWAGSRGVVAAVGSSGEMGAADGLSGELVLLRVPAWWPM